MIHLLTATHGIKGSSDSLCECRTFTIKTLESWLILLIRDGFTGAGGIPPMFGPTEPELVKNDIEGNYRDVRHQSIDWIPYI